jgi:hypothetical protein
MVAAIAKRGEQQVLKTYASAAGRSRVQADLLAHLPEALRQEFSSLSTYSDIGAMRRLTVSRRALQIMKRTRL